MTTLSPDTPSGTPPIRPASATRPFYWSVRRELWENRSIFVAPLAVAGLLLLGVLISLRGLPDSMRLLANADPAHQAAAHAQAYHFATAAIMLTGLVVGIFYALGALYNERKDRSILFWKSLPVSDFITVLSKASLPLAIVPLLIFALVVVTQTIMLLLATMVIQANGLSAAPLWNQLFLVQNWLVLLYILVVMSLWHAPLYGWLLLVSAWAKRAPFLWAFLAPLGLCLVEKVAFDTTLFVHLLGYRLSGFKVAFVDGAVMGPSGENPLSRLDPIGFLSSPGLWAGLAVATAFLAGAIWLRRRREPI